MTLLFYGAILDKCDDLLNDYVIVKITHERTVNANIKVYIFILGLTVIF